MVVGSLNAIRKEGAIVLPSVVEGYAHSHWPKREVSYPRIVFVKGSLSTIYTHIYIYTHKQIVRLSCFLLEISKEGRKYRKEYSVEILQRLFPTFLEDPM